MHAVIRSLLRAREILEKSESYYIGNKLFIDPYLYWIQRMEPPLIPKDLTNALRQELIETDDIRSRITLKLDSLHEEISASCPTPTFQASQDSK